ncbi:nitrate/nitrite transporter NrtS [Bradyrhizobium sediminis]|uniref:Nitrate/nitrite transporter NrtS n=1 Tax=Bradyrhizobium sediminis TaxID=2840469 RepID=A0A975NVI6_9BRAD|nr:nitrate/nitrite transporter NrtS [Bradyrhizobium sediminis]QWG22163.1 nitrate/nitrite transporter NrtS [Bradyrhizobium sediminis]
MSTIKRAWHFAVTDGVPSRSLYVTFIVGTLLNVINQGDVLLAAGSISWFKIALTYIVPYCVSTYGAVSFRMRLPATASK